jgi:hypothetical protein
MHGRSLLRTLLGCGNTFRCLLLLHTAQPSPTPSRKILPWFISAKCGIEVLHVADRRAHQQQADLKSGSGKCDSRSFLAQLISLQESGVSMSDEMIGELVCELIGWLSWHTLLHKSVLRDSELTHFLRGWR